MDVTREQALRYRHHRHRPVGGASSADHPLLDLGVQDTGGPSAAGWALALRRVEVAAADLVYAWTLRGAPHAYRRRDVEVLRDPPTSDGSRRTGTRSSRGSPAGERRTRRPPCVDTVRGRHEADPHQRTRSTP